MSLRLEGIEKRYGRVAVARALFLEVRRGECVWISGINGAGKSTMLRIASGLCRPDCGQVFVGPSDLYSWKKPKDRALALRSIGAYLGSSFLYEELSAQDNLLLYAKLFGIKRPADTVQRYADMLGCRRALTQRVKDCSVGTKRRIALTRVFLASPTVLLLDEPFAHLDTDGCDQLSAVLKQRVEEGALAVITGHGARPALAQRHYELDSGALFEEEA